MSEFDALAKAVKAYDEAIHQCANDPEKMSSFCTAQGDDLDTLYLNMVNLANRAVQRELAERLLARSAIGPSDIYKHATVILLSKALGDGWFDGDPIKPQALSWVQAQPLPDMSMAQLFEAVVSHRREVDPHDGNWMDHGAYATDRRTGKDRRAGRSSTTLTADAKDSESKDAARYRWLRDYKGTACWIVGPDETGKHWGEWAEAELDIAIDAAMAATECPEKTA